MFTSGFEKKNVRFKTRDPKKEERRDEEIWLFLIVFF